MIKTIGGDTSIRSRGRWSRRTAHRCRITWCAPTTGRCAIGVSWESQDTEVRTNELGRYRIPYDPAQLKEWGKTRADLKVEVHDPSGDVKLAESPLILRALPHETVNFSIGEQRYRGPDEFTRVERGARATAAVS